MTCFLRIEMHYLGPWVNRLSTWMLDIKSKRVCSTHGFFCIYMSLEIVDICGFVRPSLGSHEDMNNMSDDWS